MAPRVNALAVVCSSCRSSLVRTFSSTSRRSRTFPSFTPTGQPELDAIFEKYRETLFVPENLSKAHRRLVYRPSKQQTLTNEPGVTVSISDEEEIRLRPMSLTERPVKQKTLSKLISLLGKETSPEAWSNLLPFLEGMKSSHEPINSARLENITRKSNMRGTQRFVIECAEQAERTGLSLRDPFVTRELLSGCRERAVGASFQGDDFEKAARQVQHIVFLMEKPEHCNTKNFQAGHFDMRRSLFVNSVVLEMTAARAFFASEQHLDSDGEVGRSLARVLALSQPTASGRPDFTMQEFVQEQQKRERDDRPGTRVGKASTRLEHLMPVWSGLNFASKLKGVVSGQDKDALQKRLSDATAEVNAAEADLKSAAGENQERRALKMLASLRAIHA